MARNYNPRKAKEARSYTVEELAELYDCHQHTVYNWVKSGLQPIDDQFPMLINGATVNQFHRQNRQSARQKCGPTELFCLSCRAPRNPDPDTIKLRPMPLGSAVATGHCSTCGRGMRQNVGAKKRALLETESQRSTNSNFAT